MKKDKIKNKNREFKTTTSGFTLVEALFAIFILTFVIVGLMTVVASSLFSSRYAKQEIVMNFLLQEAADAIRNDRDTRVFLGDLNWDNFVTEYVNNCKEGCRLEINPKEDGGDFLELVKGGNPTLFINEYEDLMYSHDKTSGSVDSGIKRSIRAKRENKEFYSVDEDGNFHRKEISELQIEITVSWKERTRSLKMSLLDWRP